MDEFPILASRIYVNFKSYGIGGSEIHLPFFNKVVTAKEHLSVRYTYILSFAT